MRSSKTRDLKGPVAMSDCEKLTDAHQWKKDELSYCTELVETSGNREVPASRVAQYLQLQMEDAVRDGSLTAAQKLLDLLVRWRGRGSWGPGGRL